MSPSAHIRPEKFPVILATIYPVIEPPESAVQALLVPLLVSGVYVPFRRLLPSPLHVPVTLKTLPFSVNVNCTCESGDVTVPVRLLFPGVLWQGPPNSETFRLFGRRETKEI